MMSRTLSRARSLVLVALVVSSVFAPMLALGAATASAATAPPSGLVGVDASNVDDIRPDGVERTVSVDDLGDAVYVSRHAETTEVDIVTGSQAGAVANGASPADIAGEKVCANAAAAKRNPATECDTGAQMALVISDDVHHDGRTVAVRVDVVEEALGYVPETIAIANNETGETWTSPAEVREGWLVADVEHFSSNSVSFTGTISIDANPAQDGDTFTYEINDLDSVSNYTINVTGSTNRANETTSQSAMPDGGSMTVDVGGTKVGAGTLSVTGYLPDGTGAIDAGHEFNANDVHQWAAAGGGRVFTASNEASTVYANDSATMNAEWSHTLSGGEGIKSLHHSGSTVYVGTSTGVVYALSETDGSEQWSSSLHTELVKSIWVDGTYIYTSSNDNTVASHALSDRTQQWSNDLGTASAPEVSGSGSMVAVGTDANDVIAYSASDGSEQWTHAVGGSVAGLAVSSGQVFASEGSTGTVYALDRPDGSEQWTTATGTSATGDVRYHDGVVYSFNRHAKTKALRATDGAEIWHMSDTGSTTSGQALYGALDTTPAGAPYVFAGTNAGWLYKLVNEHTTRDPTVTDDGTTVLDHSGFVVPGETVTASVSSTLSLGENTYALSTSDSTAADVAVEVEEITETVDPAVEVNGQTTSYTGTLADGETTSLSTNTSWVENGTNTVNVTASPSVSADDPTPQVDLAYSHDATSTHSINYSAEELTVRYEVGKNFTSDQTGVEMNISFDHTVYEMRDIESQVNGGGWSNVASSDYTVNDQNALVVDIGSVSKGDTVEIRANGSRIETRNMTVTVVDPTTTGDELDSKIRIESKGEDARMVLAKGSSAKLYYPTLESWSSPKGYVLIEASGRQTMYLPNAAAGETFRLKQHETEVIPASNDVEVRVTDSGVEPTLRIMPGATEGDEVKFIYYATTSGETYVLDSVTHGTARDQAEANSPVVLWDDDGLETLEIYQEDSTATTDGTGSSDTESLVQGAKEATSDLPPWVILFGALGITVGLYYLDRRTPGERHILLVIGAVPTWLVGLELMGVPVISLPLVAASDGLGRVFPAIALMLTGLVIYVVHSWWTARKTDASTPDEVTNVDFTLSNDKGGD